MSNRTNPHWVDAFFEGVTDAIIVLDGNFKIQFLNPVAAQGIPGSASEHVGKSVWDVQPAYIGTEIETRIRDAKKSGKHELFTSHSGEKIFQYRIFPINGGGLALFRTDMTEWARSVDIESKTREHVLSRSQELAQIGHWTWNFLTNQVEWSDTMFTIYGLKKDSFSYDLEEALKATHPDDAKALRTYADTIGKGNSAKPIEYRVVQPNGEIRYCYAVTDSTRRDEFGKVIEITGIVHDITEKKNAAEMRAGLQMRDEFMSIASHELKTPLTSLDMALQLIRKLVVKGAPGSDVQMQTLTYKAMESCQRLTELVNELLDLTRIRVGKVKLNVKRVGLKAVVEDSIRQVATDLGATDVPVTIFAGDEVEGDWDHSRLAQVATHLLSNALKYGEGRAVEVHIAELGPRGGARLIVRDYGRGIPPDYHKLIFERFERGPDTGAIKGFGLGLYVARQIIEAHGGTIRVESELGQGARFVIELPRSAPHG